MCIGQIERYSFCYCRWLQDLIEVLEMGIDWSLREGYAWPEDKEHCEEQGRMLQADSSKVSLIDTEGAEK